MTSSGPPDVVVVGGGAVGCASALELAKARLDVVLVERDAVGSHASGFAYGGLFPNSGSGIPGPLLPWAKHAIERHKVLQEELRKVTEIDTQFRSTASLEVAFTAREYSALTANAQWQRHEGFSVEILDGDQVRRYEPFLSRDAVGGVLQESHYEVDSYRYTLALATAFERNGGHIRHGTVTGVSPISGGVEVAFDSGERMTAGAAVLCMGPWGGDDRFKGVPALPIRPVKGEIVRLSFPGESFGRRLTGWGFYAARKPDGLVWAGSTYEEAGFNENPSPEARNSILEGVVALAPALQDAGVVEHTACLRPVSRDNMPVVGEIESNVFAANGAERKGILLSPVMAEAVAGLITRTTDIPSVPAEFRAGRFLSG